MQATVGLSPYTKSVMDLVNIIHGKSPLKDSLFEQAEQFFINREKNQATLRRLKSEFEEAELRAKSANKKNEERLQNVLKEAKLAYKEETTRQLNERLKRLESVINVCSKIIKLSENCDWNKTQVNSAKFLGTLQMLCPTDGLKLQEEKQRFKPAYKAVLSMRLLDKLLMDRKLNQQYFQSRFDAGDRYSENGDGLTTFHKDIAIPVIIAAIFQDVGLLHQNAQRILCGADGNRDKFAVLDKESRMALLKVNHTMTLDYIIEGLGAEQYIGGSKQEREIFNAEQERRLKLIRALLNGALQPKQGIGNLIKVPQIYTSFVFSSKPEQSLADIPKAGLIIANAAKQGAVSQVAVNSLISIVGHFPQGFGITYIPKEPDGKPADTYEYAVVIGLNPNNAYEPTCRGATRNLTFIGNGQVFNVDVSSNLYFPEPKKKLEKINPERLKKILEKLVSNYEERKNMDLIPSYWDPHGFFEHKDFQNLWKKV